MTREEAALSAEYQAVVEASKKTPTELLLKDSPNWYFIETTQKCYYMRGSRLGNMTQSPLIYVLPPEGAWKISRAQFPERELALSKLTRVNVADLVLDPARRYDMDWDLATVNFRKKDAKTEIAFFGEMLPVTAYRDDQGRIITRDGYCALMLAWELGIETLLCWLMETKNGYAMNRHRYAAESGALPEVSEELNGVLSTPLMCPTYSAEALAGVYRAPVGDRLDALYQAIAGNKEPLRKIRADDLEWIKKFTR